MATSDLFVSGSDYHRSIESLIARIHASGWAFDHIVCIARGGLQAGEILSRAYRKPLAILIARKEAGVPRISALSALEEIRGAVLLIDDMAATGATLAAASAALKAQYPAISALRKAVLWRQPACSEEIDYYAAQLQDNTRLHPPHEPFVLNSLDGLLERVRQREEREGK